MGWIPSLMAGSITERLVELRRSFHRYPEPAWREFYTTSRLVTELRSIGVDELAVGPEAYDPEDRMAVPEREAIEPWRERARERGADEELLARMEGGNTGVVAVLDRGDGPTVGLRVDIDGLFVEEADDERHTPASAGFSSDREETMHACGHDAHMTWGLAVVEAVANSEFEGRFVAFFQPAEEVSGGGYPMANSEFVEGLDYLFAVHVGLGHPTGEIVAGIERPLAMSHVEATFHGQSAHAGKAPQEGDNAMQALGTAIQNTYAIPRHGDGMTRVNVGRAEAGSASNVIPERAHVEAECRGETTDLMEYAKEQLTGTFRQAAEMHGCDVDVDVVSESPRSDSDPALVDVVANVAADIDTVENVVRTADFGASEDATFLMNRVQEQGGLATYLIVGTDHPTGHHEPRFDVDERSLPVGVELLTDVVCAVGAEDA